MEEFKKEQNLVLQREEKDYKLRKKALQIVENFIIDRKLIIYGGLAIDNALRVYGEKIYDDETLPDYDVFSPNSVTDAYDLADILHTAGFKLSSAINAIHSKTMRVKFDFIYVCDLTFIPKDVLSKIKTFTYKNLIYTHPFIQYCDIHRSLATPFYGFPNENIFNRAKKDFERFNQLYKHYPTDSVKKTWVEKRASMPSGDEKNIISGFPALAAIIGGPDIKEYTYPVWDTNVVFVCSEKKEDLDPSILDIRPPSHTKDGITYYFEKNPPALQYKEKWIISINYLLLYFLENALFTDNRYFYYYNSLLEFTNNATLSIFPSSAVSIQETITLLPKNYFTDKDGPRPIWSEYPKHFFY